MPILYLVEKSTPYPPMYFLRVPQRRRASDIRRPQQPPIYIQHHAHEVKTRLGGPKCVVHRGLTVVVTDPNRRVVGQKKLENRCASSSCRQVNDGFTKAVSRSHVHPAGG